MKKLQIALIVISLFLLVFVSCSTPHSQDRKKLKTGMPNTIALSNGEVVYNLNGVWDLVVEFSGPWKSAGTGQNIIKITQTGSSLVGITMKDTRFHLKGHSLIRAELYQSGFKKVKIISDTGDFVVPGKIYDDGNKIILDDRYRWRGTLTKQ